ncbi:hypothetical protein EV363DRAFT_1582409 [Boletus edulis]|nr:hypothetical protein EV363DRAFT_1582409 [Boletus edulis]
MDPYNHPWYQPPYNPHVYLPPQYNDPYHQRASGWHPYRSPARDRTPYTLTIRIISKAFPWSADIRAPAGSVVTCSAIFEGLYKMLQEPIADSEWGIVVTEKTKKETIEKAAKARQERDRDRDRDRDNRLKRIDWLGETTAFKGLERDEEFEKKRLLPGMQACKETWVIKFGKP